MLCWQAEAVGQEWLEANKKTSAAMRSGDYDEAVKWAELAVDGFMESSHFQEDAYANLVLAHAEAEYARQNMVSALKVLRAAAFRLEPENEYATGAIVDLSLFQADMYQRGGQPHEVELAYNRAIAAAGAFYGKNHMKVLELWLLKGHTSKVIRGYHAARRAISAAI